MLLDLDSNANWCLSGGADGSDLQFGMCAGARGDGVIHFSFRGHETSAPDAELVVLTQSQLQAADRSCRVANKSLRRKFPAKSLRVTNLLRRDWYQVETAQACYGVSVFDRPSGETIPLGTVFHMRVKGGTAWAVQMFIDRHHGAACPCYVFDQVLCHWFQWVGEGWQCIYEPPKPSGIYAGIGIRDILPMGKLAIRVLMDYKRTTDTPVARQQAEAAARRRFEERARLLEGHKMGSWESLSDLMKEALIHHEMTRQHK
jgi:hypothetical protein